MGVILDANVLLSGLLIGHGPPAKLLDAWERALFTLVDSNALIAEFREGASRPFFKARLRASVVEMLAAGLRDFSVFYQDLPSGPKAPDPKDSHLLALAEASTAEFLVTGDTELQSLKHHKSTQIVSRATMINLLKEVEKDREEGESLFHFGFLD